MNRIENGTRIRTIGCIMTPLLIAHSGKHADSTWSDPTRADAKWGVEGTIIAYSDSHGLVYEVQHDCGGKAWYEPGEVALVKTMEAFKWEGADGTYKAFDRHRCLMATVSRFQSINRKSLYSYDTYWWISHHKRTGKINEERVLSNEQREHPSLEAAMGFIGKLYDKE